MVRVIFDGSNLHLGNYFPQEGGGIIGRFEAASPFQRGYGHFSAMARQRGAGLGSVLRNVWRYLRPLASSISPITTSIGKAVGKEALSTTARVIDDVVGGTDLKSAVKAQGREGLRKLASQAATKLQSGTGRKRKYKRRPIKRGRVILKPELIGQTVPGRAILKKKRADNLGYY
jgi:hypothetical protein